MSNPRAAGATTTGVGSSHQRRADLRRMSGDLPFKRFVFTAVPALRAYVGRPLSHTMAPQARAVEGLGAEELEDLGPKGPKATSLSRPGVASVCGYPIGSAPARGLPERPSTARRPCEIHLPALVPKRDMMGARRCRMGDRSFLVGGVLAAVVGLTVTGGARAEEAWQPALPQQVPPAILNLTNQSGTLESRDKAFTESVKRDALAPRPSALDDWEPQSDGSMRNKRSGVRLIVRNPCPPGDIEHEFALAAYNRALSAKPRR